MASTFLSYSSARRDWIETFRRTGLLEELIPPSSGSVIFDYVIDGAKQGRYQQDIKKAIEQSDIFIALVDETYTRSADCMFEFDAAYPLFYRVGRPLPRKAFGLIFLHKDGLGWFNLYSKDQRHRFPEDSAYCKMFNYRGLRSLFTENGPDTDAWEELRKFLRDIRKCVGLEDEPKPARAEPLQIVLVGHPTDLVPTPAVGVAFDTLKSSLEHLHPAILSHGWRTQASNTYKFLARTATSSAIFVFAVDSAFALLSVASPTILADQLRAAVAYEETGEGLQPFGGACIVYWMPPGIEDARFRERARDQGLLPGPQFRVGSADEMVEWLVPSRPAPPIRYESAPLDRAVRQLAMKLRNRLDGTCRPPEPKASAFIPNERPLTEELADIAKAGSGIFITHAVNINATSDTDIPEDLMQKVLAYVDALDAFCKTNGIDVDQIYRVALVRQRDRFWSGPWTIDVGKQNARLLGWRFLGIRKGKSGSFEMDEKRVDELVNDVTALVQA